MPKEKRFNIRVYGLLLADARILLADEIIQGREITKFPGGGLEWGEGPIACLEREWKEETGVDVSVDEHFYTTDFFQRSAFDQNDQVLSIYYKVSVPDASALATTSRKFDFQGVEGEEAFRWHPLQQLQPEDLTMPIDQVVAEMLRGSL